jgi:probable rRNA maturation factor
LSLDVDVATDGVRIPLARARVAAVARGVLRAEGVRDARLSIAFVSSRVIARMNRRHLGHGGMTDVISFPLLSSANDEPIAGDVYIAPDVARANAREHGVLLREEIARLVVHGTLHVLGHDHPETRGRTASPMWRRQEQLLARLAGEWRS